MDPAYLLLLGALLTLVGLAGTILPLLPGTLLVFAGLAVAAWADDFTRVGAVGLVIIGLLGAVSLVADFVGSLAGARRVGASPLALAGAALGGLVGLLFGIVGLVLGPFVGAVAGEYIARRRVHDAARVGLGTGLGLLLAAVAKIVIAFLMIATFLAFYFLNGR